MTKTLLSIFLICAAFVCFGQVDARMFRYPDVSADKIIFTYADDIWIVDKQGGTATHLSSPAGVESHPKFSPDGQEIAFSGNYEGNTDVYTMSINGGMPERKTWHNKKDRVVEWHPNGEQVLFASPRKSGKNRWNQFYLTGVYSGLPTKLPLEHAEYGSYSKDGNTIVFTDKSRLTRNWKRYRGGTAADIWTMNLKTKEAEKIAKNSANDELPMIKGEKVYFLSDRGPNMCANLWVYNSSTKATRQLTTFKDTDIHWPSMGPQDIVFEAKGKLYLFDLTSETKKEITVSVVTDQRTLRSKQVDVKDRISNVFVSHDAKRIAIEARGDIFSVPVENGYTENLTQTTGVAERYPAWSPNGKYLAFWSDATGEYQLVLRDMEENTEKTVTNFEEGFRYKPMWSPDSKKLVFIEQDLEIKMMDIEKQEIVVVDSLSSGFHGTTLGFEVKWDKTSQWFTWGADRETGNRSIVVYDVEKREKNYLTSGFYNDNDPCFSADGKYIFFLTDRSFSPQYSSLQGTWVYRNSTKMAAIPLTKETPSPLMVKNDEVTIKQATEKKDEKKEKKDSKKKEKEEEKEKKKGTTIEFEGIESRIVMLPVKAASLWQLNAVPGKIIFKEGKDVKFYDIKEQKVKTIISDVRSYSLAADGKKLLVRSGSKIAVIAPNPGQKMSKPIKIGPLTLQVNPKEEWKQIYKDAWRLERDYFYDKNMHGVNWLEVYDRYAPLIDQCVTRSDVNFVLGQMLAELNASHAYNGGGDMEYGEYTSVGYLGVDYGFENGHYKIAHIVKGSNWDASMRSPLDQSGLKVNEGVYLLAVNGVKLNTSKSPFAAFENLANKTIELTVNDKPEMKDARKVLVKTMSNEYRLRHLEWIESKRKRVEEATNGQVGYIYVPNTGVEGQSELVRQYMGQWKKDALIIDERWNSGGQIPDRFVELLNRTPYSYLAGRTGKDRQVPYVAHFGPKVMMINGWSGSGGDAFPDYFRKAGIGELIGTRTWGGLIGISGAPTLIDGGRITVPTFRLYDPNGKWFREGHGVDPDIEVDEDAGELAKGIDPQLEKTIEVILQKLETQRFDRTPHEPYENR